MDDFLEVSDIQLSSHTVFIVYRMDPNFQDRNDLAQLWGQYDGVGHVALDARRGSNELGFSFDGNAGTRALYQIDGTPKTSEYFANTNLSPWAYGNWQILVVEFEDAVTLDTLTVGHLGATFPIGQHHFGGAIGEIMSFDRLLDLNEYEQTLEYLRANWQ